MFSDHLQKIDHASGKTLFLWAAGLVIVCQLIAMVLVAQGQVEKAQMRKADQASQRTATAWCIETHRDADLKGCKGPLPAYSVQNNNPSEMAKPDGYTPVTAASRY